MQSHRYFSLIPCQTPLWAPDRHSQTILADLLPSQMLSHPGQKWVLQHPDGDQIICRVHDQNSDVVVTLFHGLVGSAEAKYMQRAAIELLKAGYTVVLVNHRNCGEGKGLAKQPYHSGKSDDIGYVIKQVRTRFVQKKVMAVGFSMSANALLLLMSRVVPNQQIFTESAFEEKKEELGVDLPDWALTINAPINLEKTSHLINRRLNRVYEAYFMSSLHRLIKELEQTGVLEQSVGLHRLMKVSYFDDVFTAPRSGFQSGPDYYRSCSARDHLEKVNRPTACLTSQNDPFIDFSDYLEARRSKSIYLHIEKHGGHMGYLHKENTPLGTQRWLDYGITEIVKSLTA